MLGSISVGQGLIDLAALQRHFVSVVPEADHESFANGTSRHIESGAAPAFRKGLLAVRGIERDADEQHHDAKEDDSCEELHA
jgi:hypothetical protein